MEDEANTIERDIMAMLKANKMPQGDLFLQIRSGEGSTNVKWLKTTEGAPSASGQINLFSSKERKSYDQS